ncbi:MAG: 50S ribosomal protein L25 [Chloroflexi bacterium]|nr:50S ribosomal protein L25 [Chloroflexota bacterium]
MSSEKLVLTAQPREIIGKKVKQLRRKGIVPAIAYGPGSEPVAIQLNERELRFMLMRAGGTQVIELDLGEENIPTLVREVQRDPIRGDIMHVDFYRVDLSVAIAADVPLVIGEQMPAPVEQGLGDIMQNLSAVQVEALPNEIPQELIIEIGHLQEIGDQILASDIALPEGVTLLTPPDEMVLKIDYVQEAPAEEDAEDELSMFDEVVAPEIITERKDDEE